LFFLKINFLYKKLKIFIFFSQIYRGIFVLF